MNHQPGLFDPQAQQLWWFRVGETVQHDGEEWIVSYHHRAGWVRIYQRHKLPYTIHVEYTTVNAEDLKAEQP